MNIWMLTQGPIHIYWNIKALQHLSIQNPPGTCLEGYAFACREGNGTPLQYFCLEDPMDGGAWRAAVHGVAKSQAWLSNFTFTFHFHSLEKEMATHSSILAWRIPGMGEPSGLLSMGSHRVGHDWSDLTAAATAFACMRAQSLSCIWIFVTPWTVAYQTPLSMELSVKNPGVGCHFLLWGISNLCLLGLLHWQVDSLPLRHLGGPVRCIFQEG